MMIFGIYVCFKLGATLDTTQRVVHVCHGNVLDLSKIFCWVQGSERYVPQADTTQGPGCPMGAVSRAMEHGSFEEFEDVCISYVFCVERM